MDVRGVLHLVYFKFKLIIKTFFKIEINKKKKLINIF